MRYTLIYNERLGITPIFLYYNEFEEAINSSPVSLLSLFEAKALLSETIFEYEYHSTRNDYVMKSKCQIDFINNLNNSQDLEYTSFIRFAFQVWGKESFLEVLKALKYILGFSIKIPDVALSSIPVSIIESVFYVCDKKNISSLKMEFSRGEARPALALILIVLFMSSLKSEEFRIHDINLFIQDLFDKYCLKFELVEAMLDLQREVQDECFNSISGDKVIQALRPLSQDLLHDSTNTLYAPLIECIFGCDTLKPINPIKINFDDYQDRNIELIGKIDSNSIINSRRQHLTPNQYHQWLDDMSNNKDPNLRTTWLEG